MTKCFFAMFDIIGFSNLLKERGSEGLYRLYSNAVLPMLQHAAMPVSKLEEKNGKTVSVPDPTSQRVYFTFFSDTIIYYSKDDSFESFFSIVLTSLQLLVSGFGGLKAPYRGAIGHGDIIADSSGILLGTSLIDAYKGEQSQMWAGCILTEACESICVEKKYFDLLQNYLETALQTETDEVKRTKIKKTQKTLIKYNVKKQKKTNDKPIVYFEQEHIVLDWTHNIYVGAAEKSFNPSDIPHQEMIRRNTIEFEKWVRQNNAVTT